MRGMGTRVSRSITKDTWYSSSLFPPPLLSVSDTTTRTVPLLFQGQDQVPSRGEWVSLQLVSWFRMSHCMIWVKRINFALEFGLWNVFCVAFFL